MSCGCPSPDKTGLWTPIPAFRQPTDMMPGENLDCYARRAGNDTGLQDDARDDVPNKIQNTSINPKADLTVNETLTLTTGPRTATSWEYTPTLSWLTLSGNILSGTCPPADEGKVVKITISAKDGTGVIDSREFTFVPKKPSKDDSISLIIPYKSTNGQTPKVNSGFGPRLHPIDKKMKNHDGQDWVGGGKGEIVAAADGEVIACLPSGSTRGYGNRVIIAHHASNGTLMCHTTYSHLSRFVASRGQKVAAGQTVAIEGSTGGSTGPHLHFELLLGGKQKVDPAPYIRGSYSLQPPRQADGSLPPAIIVNNGNSPALTSATVKARTEGDCPKILDNGSPPAPNTPEPPGTLVNRAASVSDCVADPRPTFTFVMSEIDRALNESSLTAEDKKLIKFFAKIESTYDPYAKNKTSSATGLYQMLDKIAVRYYGIIGIPPTCVNRCNAYYATKAMIEFYTREIKAYWNEYNASGQTKMAGKLIKPSAHSARFPSLSQGEFCYGLLHHDGVGNAVAGIDRGGVTYFRKASASA